MSWRVFCCLVFLIAYSFIVYSFQYDESLEETLGIPDGSSKTGSEKKSKDSSEVFDLDFDNEKKQEKVKNTSKGTSDADADDSEKESVSSASATLRNRGLFISVPIFGV